jgi:hypothetical protein
MAGVGSLAGAWFSSVLMHRGFSLDRARKAVLLPSAAACWGNLLLCGGLLAAIAMLAVALFGHQWSSNLHTTISISA